MVRIPWQWPGCGEGKPMRINVTRSSMPSFEEYCQEIRPLWDSHILTNNGCKHKEFQQKLSSLLHAPYVELFTNGHLALEALLAALQLKGEVITTPFTFASTTHAITRKGLTPVFCDIRETDYTLDPQKIEALITPRTSAILPVHVYGCLCDTEAIQAIADRHGLPVIYDAAHAFGVMRAEQSVAQFGLASMFSFHATKVLHSIEGGAIATQNSELQLNLALERNYGITGPEDIVSVGGNAKMSEFQAAMGLCNLRHVHEDIQGRRQVYELYIEMLKETEGLRLPPVQPDVKGNYAYFPVVFQGGRTMRDAVCEALERKNIFARKYFFPLTTDFECYRNKPGFDSAQTPVAKRISDGVATLPLYPGLAQQDVELICRIIKRRLACGE